MKFFVDTADLGEIKELASIRTVGRMREAALIGADVVTVPPGFLKALAQHPLTGKGLAQFVADWAKVGQKIL